MTEAGWMSSGYHCFCSIQAGKFCQPGRIRKWTQICTPTHFSPPLSPFPCTLPILSARTPCFGDAAGRRVSSFLSLACPQPRNWGSHRSDELLLSGYPAFPSDSQAAPLLDILVRHRARQQQHRGRREGSPAPPSRQLPARLPPPPGSSPRLTGLS